MIPAALVRAWRLTAPWTTNAQVEQDLIISRALVEAYQDKVVAERLAFRGERRFTNCISVRPFVTRKISILSKCKRSELERHWLRAPWPIGSAAGRTQLGYRKADFAVTSDWFKGRAQILGYDVNELLGTKLRALYQRRKGRDLFDLAMAIERIKEVDGEGVVRCFREYMQRDGHQVSRAEFEENLAIKMASAEFRSEVGPLLASEGHGVQMGFNAATAYEVVHGLLIQRLEGKPWKGLKT